MHILMIGCLSVLGVEAAKRFRKEGHHVTYITADDITPLSHLGSRIKAYRTPLLPEQYRHIIAGKAFSVCFYLGGMTGDESDEAFLHAVERQRLLYDVFECLRDASVWIVALADCHLINSDLRSLQCSRVEQIDLLSNRYIQEFCRQFDKKYTLLRIGHVYGPGTQQSNIINRILSGNEETYINAHAEDSLNLLYVSDAVDALYRVLAYNVYGDFYVTSNEWLHVGDLIGRLNGQNTKIEQPYRSARHYSAINSDFKKHTDWIPVVTLKEGLSRTIGHLEKMAGQPAPASKKKAVSFLKKVLPYIETIAGFVLMMLLQSLVSSAPDLRFLDVRMIYVAIIAAAHGMGQGVLAGVLCCLPYYLEVYGAQQSISELLNYTNRWLPFICYLLLGSALGYWRDQLHGKIKETQDRIQLLKDKHQFLSGIYCETQQAKQALQEQVFNHQDSFGRVYRLASEMDFLESERVLSASIGVLERGLNSKSIAIYWLSNNHAYARLAWKSAELQCARSIKLDTIPELIPSLIEKGIFVSDNFTQPISYAAPIWQKDRLIAMVTFFDCELKQYTVAFQNKLRVISGLMQSALIRSWQYELATADQTYIAGTHLLLPGAFENRCHTFDDACRIGVSEGLVFRIYDRDHTYFQMSKTLIKLLRSNDFMGYDNHHNLCVVFRQARQEDEAAIIRRFKESGLTVSPIQHKGVA